MSVPVYNADLLQALTLLDYLLKTGSERVAQQCCENVFTIQVLQFPKHTSRLHWDQMLRSRALFWLVPYLFLSSFTSDTT